MCRRCTVVRHPPPKSLGGPSLGICADTPRAMLLLDLRHFGAEASLSCARGALVARRARMRGCRGAVMGAFGWTRVWPGCQSARPQRMSRPVCIAMILLCDVKWRAAPPRSTSCVALYRGCVGCNASWGLLRRPYLYHRRAGTCIDSDHPVDLVLILFKERSGGASVSGVEAMTSNPQCRQFGR